VQIKTANWFATLPDDHIKIGISRGTPRGQDKSAGSPFPRRAALARRMLLATAATSGRAN
jgi:hypothetical protein